MLSVDDSSGNGLGLLGLIGIFVLGLGLYFLEIFLPSGGLIFLGATLCVVYALWQMVASDHTWVAVVCSGVTVIYGIWLFRWGIARLSFSASLGEETSTGDDVKSALALIGSSGRALTALRPAGVAEIEGTRFDVVTSGGFLEAGAEVRVRDVSGNRIVVVAVTDDPTNDNNSND